MDESERSSVRLVIADDNERAKSNLVRIFDGTSFVIAAEASDGREAVELCGEVLPDLVIMDVRMPGMDGIEATREIKRLYPRVSVLMLTAFEDTEYLLSAVSAGASGYVLKHAEPDDVVRAARDALSGKHPLDPELSSAVVRSVAREGREVPTPYVVRVWMLGGFSVSVSGRAVPNPDWRTRKNGSLVKLLALAENHRLHRERAMEFLWPNSDAKSQAGNLHRALHFARKSLRPAEVSLRGDMLTLCPASELRVDVEAFEEAVRTARQTRDTSAYRTAIELYGGELLPEDLYEEWVEEKRSELRSLYVALHVEVAGIHEHEGEYTSAIEALQKITAGEGSHEESAHVALMRLFALRGEGSRAVAQFRTLERSLATLGSEPSGASRRLCEEISGGAFPNRPFKDRRREARSAGRHNLPEARTSFVGRGKEMAEVKRSLSMTRLLTLTGTGGCGKTRLAVETARSLAGAYPDGVWMARFAPISDETLVARTVASVLGVRERPGTPISRTLSEYLRTKRTLLILDNCEHVVEAVAWLSDALLASCGNLRILATSREPLGVPGEVVRLTPTLTSPGGKSGGGKASGGKAGGGKAGGSESGGGDLMRYESVRLFIERTRAKLPAFGLTEANARAVSEVCQKLDGIPLAIELAAARMAALAIEEVAEKLNESLNFLALGERTAEPRHKTMRATMEWSHNLLSDEEKILFRRLSVFAGGWTLEAAEEIGGKSVIESLEGLVEKSLVVADSDGDGGMRYRMLEPVRQFAREKLDEIGGETEEVRERHGIHFLAFGEVAEVELMGVHPSACLEKLGMEIGNIRAALSWMLEEDEGERAEMGLRLSAALWRFWEACDPSEGRRWIEAALEKSVGRNAPVRAKALNVAGFTAVYEGDARAVELLEESLAIYEELGDEAGAATAMSSLGHATVHVEARERVEAIVRGAKRMLARSTDGRARAHLLAFLGFVAAGEHDFDGMEARLGEAFTIFRELDDIWNAGVCIISMGHVSIMRSDPSGAERFEEGLRYQRELKQQLGINMAVAGMAGVAALLGQATRAAKMMGFVETHRERIGATFQSSSKVRYDYEKYVATIRAALDEAALEAAWNEGRAMTSEEAVEYSLSDEDKTGATPPERGIPKPHDTTLTRREKEIAALVGRGLSNREISGELRISERTVEGHVSKVLRKLGLRSRTGVAAWVLGDGFEVEDE